MQESMKNVAKQGAKRVQKSGKEVGKKVWKR